MVQNFERYFWKLLAIFTGVVSPGTPRRSRELRCQLLDTRHFGVVNEKEKMKQKQLVMFSAWLGGLGVVLGAFGAHALKARVDASSLENWKTATLYHLVHALAALVAAQQARSSYRSVLFFLCGIVLFSGSLYTLVLTQIRTLGAIAPLGGICFILGWIFLGLDREARNKS